MRALANSLVPTFVIAGLAFFPAGCSRGEEHGGSTGRGDAHSEAPTDPSQWSNLRDFTEIEATGPDNVIITQGKNFAVTVEGDADIVNKLEIKVSGDTLEIGRRKKLGISWSSSDKSATIRVTLPVLTKVEATGSGDISVDKVDGEKMKAELTGSGNLKIATVAVAALETELTGSGDIDIGGTVQELDVSVTGSGNFDGEGLKAGRAKASILGSGDSRFASDGPVDIDIMGSGNVTVKGKAQCKSSIMGSGEARCAP